VVKTADLRYGNDVLEFCYPTRRASNPASASSRNLSTRLSTTPAISLSPRSHRANVPGPTPIRLADSCCESPRLVRRQTNCPASVFAARLFLDVSLEHRQDEAPSPDVVPNGVHPRGNADH